MIGGLTLVAGGVLVAVAFISLTDVVPDFRVKVVSITAAIVGIAWLYWFDQRREKLEAGLAAERNEARFQELSALAASHQFELEVGGSSNFLVGLAMLLIGGLILVGGGDLGMALRYLGGGVAAGAGAVVLLGAIPALGKPKITLTRAGFSTPLTPPLAWDFVRGIFLQKNTHRGRVVSHFLVFHMPTLPEEISRFSLYHRFLHALRAKSGKRQLHVILRNASEAPEVVFRIAQALWTKSTGRNRVWVPGMSEEFYAADQRMDEITARLEALGATEESLLGNAGEIEGLLKEMEARGKVVSTELHSKAWVAKWAVIALIAAFLAFLAISLTGIFAR